MGVVEYLKETRGEMKHVSWPVRHQVTAFTVLVIMISLLTATLLGFFDFAFTLLLEKFIIS